MKLIHNLKSENIKISIFFLTMVMLLCACSNNENLELHPQGNNNIASNLPIDETNKCDVELNFTTVEKEILIENQPDISWILGKSIYFGDFPNQIESTIHLYVENSIKAEESAVYGFLEHEGKLYEIGVVSNYGIDSVNVNLIDRTFDQIKEIEIIGKMGAIYIEMKLISYNETSKNWGNLLTMGSPQIVDLDEDGLEELIAVSTGSIPSFVDIYRWNGNCFEKSSVTDETNNVYAILNIIDNEWVIETGSYVEGETLESTLCRYEKGKLINFN